MNDEEVEVVVFEDEGTDGKGEEGRGVDKDQPKASPITQRMSSMWSFVTKADTLVRSYFFEHFSDNFVVHVVEHSKRKCHGRKTKSPKELGEGSTDA